MPLTRVTNKHLLPVFNKPMIFYPLELMASFGIKDVLVVTGPENAGDFLKLLGDGQEFGLNLFFKVQTKAGGISHAIFLAESFVGDDTCVVILGDNIFTEDLSKYYKEFLTSDYALIFIKKVQDSQRFGVVEVDDVGNVLSIEEKPKHPRSDYAQTGLYMYPSGVFDLIRKLRPSGRGELEVTDLNKEYLKIGKLKAIIVENKWFDVGTVDGMSEATAYFIRRQQVI